MKARSIATSYRALSVLSVALLWGLYALNGGLEAFFLSSWHARLKEDIPLSTNYTGIFLIDFPVTLLVTFFYFVTDGSDEGLQLLAFEGYATLQSTFVWLYAEMARPGSHKPWVVAVPLFSAMLSQVTGGAVSLPLYFAYHILWVDSAEILRVRDTDAASALPFSFLLGAIFPAILGLAPTWDGPGSRSPGVHQRYLAFFQVDPLWVALIQTLLTKAFRWLRSGQVAADPGCAPRRASRWTQASYLLAAASSAAGHVYTAARIYTSTDPRTDLVRMKVPYPPNGPSGGLSHILARSSFLFLQFDVPIYEFASLAWAFILLSRMPNRPRMSNLTLAFIMVIGYLTIGAGATVSLALYVREGLLPEKGKAANKDGGPGT